MSSSRRAENSNGSTARLMRGEGESRGVWGFRRGVFGVSASDMDCEIRSHVARGEWGKFSLPVDMFVPRVRPRHTAYLVPCTSNLVLVLQYYR